VIAYAETFLRHPIRILAPLVIVLAIAIGFALMQPATYQATAAVWFDSRSTTTQEVAPQSDSDPADASHAADVLRELLATRAFATAVGHAGPLAAYTAAHPTDGSLITRVLVKLHLKHAGPFSAEQVDGAVAQDIADNATVTDTGPHVVTISVKGPTPAVAEGTAAAIVSQFGDSIIAARRTELQTAIAFYKLRADETARAATQADDALAAYLATLPAADQSAGPSTDPHLLALRAADDAARQQHSSAQSLLDGDQLTLDHVGDANPVRVLDQPDGAVSVGTSKRLLYAGAAGLVLGLLLSFAVLSLTPGAHGTVWRQADLAKALPEATVVGSVRQATLRRTKRAAHGAEAT
jgi:uncharacterized protein involved in exopolysaccharide biosynthesis